MASSREEKRKSHHLLPLLRLCQFAPIVLGNSDSRFILVKPLLPHDIYTDIFGTSGFNLRVSNSASNGLGHLPPPREGIVAEDIHTRGSPSAILCVPGSARFAYSSDNSVEVEDAYRFACVRYSLSFFAGSPPSSSLAFSGPSGRSGTSCVFDILDRSTGSCPPTRLTFAIIARQILTVCRVTAPPSSRPHYCAVS